MGYGLEEWKERIAQRSDFTVNLVHLTRNTEKSEGGDVLFKILTDRKLIGSTTSSGFIVGQRPAVCLQEAPLYSLAENIYTEQKYRKENPESKIRYTGYGLQFSKPYIFSKGGRPVIYDATAAAKAYLPQDHWWRIVNFDLSNDSTVIDWSHEREWRVPDELSFDLRHVTILLPNYKAYQSFVNKCISSGKTEFLTATKGIVQLGAVFF